MPIGIDGTGTITGITAGGLPDGIVNAADLNGGTPAAGLVLAATSGSAMAWRDALVQDTAKASTSGTSVDFTGIPAWVHRVTVMLSGVSTNGTSDLLVRIGSGSFASTGYAANSTIVSNAAVTGPSTAGFILSQSIAASDTYSGIVTLANVTGNTWVSSGCITRNGSGGVLVSAGTVSLGGVLDRVQLTTAGGANTFDAGTINIMYE